MLKKNLKKIISALVFSVVFVSHSSATDDFDLDDDIDLETLQEWEQEHVGPRVAQLPAGSLKLVADNVGKLVKSPLWKNTRIPRGRDVLYLFPNDCRFNTSNKLQFSYFFNKTSNIHPSLSGLLDLNINPNDAMDIIEEFLPFIQTGQEVSAQEIFNMLPLFGKISVQERRVGLYAQKVFTYQYGEIEINTSPFVFAERNFWLNQRDRNIVDELGQKMFPGEKLQESKFVRMRFGPGDTRIKCGLKPLDFSAIKAVAGASLILPTGSIGHRTRFNPIMIDGPELIQLSYNALANIRDYLLDAHLGNAGHIGLGVYGKSTVSLFKNLADLCVEVSYDNIFEGREDRLILYKKTMNPDQLVNLPNDVAAFEALQTFVPEYLVPMPFTCKVQPGNIFNFSSGIHFGIKNWHWLWGYNYYLQQREKLTRIYNTDDIDKILVSDAEMPAAHQHKLFWETSYTKPLRTTDLMISWGANFTVRSSGLGHDWTSYLRVGAKV